MKMYFITLHIKVKHNHHNLINNVKMISILTVMKHHHIILKTKNNVCHQNMSIIIQLKMTHIITKYNVHYLINITQQNKLHINV